MTKFRVLAPVLGSLLLIGSVATGQAPVKDISKGRHPNLARAQNQSLNAYNSIVMAQKAKDLLNQVNKELKLAAEQSNKNKGK
jgi:hypothetical protein